MSRFQQCPFCAVTTGGMHEPDCPCHPNNQRPPREDELARLRKRVGELEGGNERLLSVVPEGYTEPSLILKRDLLPGGGLYAVQPPEIHSLTIPLYNRFRSLMSEVLGSLELAAGRGHLHHQRVDAAPEAEEGPNHERKDEP